MGDDPDDLSLLLQGGEGLECYLEGLTVQGPESFIEEQRIDPDIPACHARESEGQGEADNETLPSGKVLRGADLPCLVIVHDIEVKGGSPAPDEEIPVAHLPEVPVRMGDEAVKGETLGKDPEFFPIRGSDQIVQLLPAEAFGLLHLESLKQLVLVGNPCLMIGHLLADTPLFLVKTGNIRFERRDLLFQSIRGLIGQVPGSLIREGSRSFLYP